MFGFTDSCPARPTKKFLGFIQCYRNHEPELLWIKRWAFGKWEAKLECKHCGERRSPFGLSDGELLWAGLPLEDIRKTCFRYWDCWHPPSPDGDEGGGAENEE